VVPPDRIVLVVAQMLGHLLLERGLEDLLVSRVNSPAGPTKSMPCALACATGCSATLCSSCTDSDVSRFLVAATSLIVSVMV
jgi:hypothetical protein